MGLIPGLIIPSYIFWFSGIFGIHDRVRRMADRHDKRVAKLSGKISGVYRCRNRRYSGMCSRFITADDRIHIEANAD